MNIRSPENGETRSIVLGRKIPLRVALNRVLELLYPSFSPVSNPDTIEQRLRESNINTAVNIGLFGFAALPFWGGVATAMYNQVDLVPVGVSVVAGSVMAFAGTRAVHFCRLSTRYDQHKRELPVEPIKEATNGNTETVAVIVDIKPSLIEVIGGYTEELGHDNVSLERRLVVRAWLLGVHKATGGALDLLRPSQGSVRPAGIPKSSSVPEHTSKQENHS